MIKVKRKKKDKNIISTTKHASSKIIKEIRHRGQCGSKIQ
jgi:hypothetical protein